jgi:hypothetical protein
MSDSHEQQLFDLLQGKSETPLQKESQAMIAEKDVNYETTIGVNPDLRPDPEDRAKGNIDATWGEVDGSQNDARHYSTEAAKQFRVGREEMLAKLFDGKQSSDGAEQKLVGAHLAHGASGEFETSSPQLSSKSKLQKLAAPETLSEQVRRVVGMR